MLCAFDKERKAILLIGGDKSNDWKGWHTKNIPIADDRFDKHQTAVAKRLAGKSKKNPHRGTSKKGKRR